jgi:hypothetical protein
MKLAFTEVEVFLSEKYWVPEPPPTISSLDFAVLV